jgi:hypothetical protein
MAITLRPKAASAASLGPVRPARGSALRMFRFERRWLVALFEALLPSGVDPRFPDGADRVPTGRYVDDFVTHAPLETVFALRAGLWVAMLAPPFLLRRFRTFMGLAPGEKVALLEALLRSRIYLVRETALLFKIFACLGPCGLPAVQARIGIHPIDGQPPEWARPE